MFAYINVFAAGREVHAVRLRGGETRGGPGVLGPSRFIFEGRRPPSGIGKNPKSPGQGSSACGFSLHLAACHRLPSECRGDERAQTVGRSADAARAREGREARQSHWIRWHHLRELLALMTLPVGTAIVRQPLKEKEPKMKTLNNKLT